jgi:hypothetical protein
VSASPPRARQSVSGSVVESRSDVDLVVLLLHFPSIRGAAQLGLTLNAVLVVSLCSFAETKLGIASGCGGGGYFGKVGVSIFGTVRALVAYADVWIVWSEQISWLRRYSDLTPCGIPLRKFRAGRRGQV